MDKTEVKIGNQTYKSLCQNCVHKAHISRVKTPRSNSDVLAEIPALDQHYCPQVRTDLIYLQYGDDQILLDVAECTEYKPLTKQK